MQAAHPFVTLFILYTTKRERGSFMNAELTFLQFLHSPMLDGSMGFITRLGDSGIL